MERALAISLAAAVAASFVGVVMIFGRSLAWAMTLPFTLAGSLLLLLPAYAMAREKGFGRGECYGAVLAVGLVGGAVILGALSGGATEAAATGAFFGVLTAAIWVAAHWITGFFNRHSANE